jgi:hypothetical protein
VRLDEEWLPFSFFFYTDKGVLLISFGALCKYLDYQNSIFALTFDDLY